MNPFAFLAVLFGTAAILAAFIGLIHYERAQLLHETLQEHTIATQVLIVHMDALEEYNKYLVAVNRQNNARAAGFMLMARALDVNEQLYAMDGEMP